MKKYTQAGTTRVANIPSPSIVLCLGKKNVSHMPETAWHNAKAIQQNAKDTLHRMNLKETIC